MATGILTLTGGKCIFMFLKITDNASQLKPVRTSGENGRSLFPTLDLLPKLTNERAPLFILKA